MQFIIGKLDGSNVSDIQMTVNYTQPEPNNLTVDQMEKGTFT